MSRTVLPTHRLLPQWVFHNPERYSLLIHSAQVRRGPESTQFQGLGQVCQIPYSL